MDHKLQASSHTQPHSVLLNAPVKPALLSECINRDGGFAVREVKNMDCSAWLKSNLE